MALPRKIKKNIPLSPVKTLRERREEMLGEITDNGTFLPQSILYDDLDGGFIRFVKERLRTVVNGKVIPVMDIILTTQNWSQFTETWEFHNMDNNPEPPFISIVKNKTGKFGTNPSLLYNIPDRRDYFHAAVPTWDGNRKGMDIYTIPQPIPQDIDFTVKVITNRLRELNEFNLVMQQVFASRQAYVNIKGHYIPIIHGDVSDESMMDLEKRKYYVQSYSFTMLGFLIDEDEFKVTPAISRSLTVMEVQEGVSPSGKLIKRETPKSNVFICENAQLWVNGENIETIPEPCNKIIQLNVVETSGGMVGSYSGGSWVVPSLVCDPFTVNVNSTEFSVIEEPCGETFNLLVVNTESSPVGGPGGADEWLIADGRVDITNSLGGVLYSLPMLPETIVGQVISDSSVRIMSTTGIILYDIDIPAEDSTIQVISDSIVRLFNTEGTTIDIITVLPEQELQATAPDGLLTLTFSGITLPGIDVPSGAIRSHALDCSTVLSFTITAFSGEIFTWNESEERWENDNGKYLIVNSDRTGIEFVDGNFNIIDNNPDGEITAPWAPGWSEITFTTQDISDLCCASCEPATININEESGIPFPDPCGNSFNLSVVNSQLAAVGTHAGENIFVILNSLVKAYYSGSFPSFHDIQVLPESSDKSIYALDGNYLIGAGPEEAVGTVTTIGSATAILTYAPTLGLNVVDEPLSGLSITLQVDAAPYGVLVSVRDVDDVEVGYVDGTFTGPSGEPGLIWRVTGGTAPSSDVLRFDLWANDDRSSIYTAAANMTLTYDSDDTGSGTWEYSINSGSWTAVTSAAIILSGGDKLQVRRSIYALDGFIQFNY